MPQRCHVHWQAHWEATKAAALASDLPLTLMNPLAGTFGYYSMLRNWMGTEGLSYLWYDDPALIHACLDFLTDLALRTLERAVCEIPFDLVYIHEDMAGKGGPLMGPKLFREFLLPHYKRLVGFLRGHGIPLVLVDTDGDHEVLIPLFLEAGVNGFGPIERAAGMDPVDLRRRYGQAFCMLGGIDKREIAKGRAAIEREVDRSVRPLVAGGGIPLGFSLPDQGRIVSRMPPQSSIGTLSGRQGCVRRAARLGLWR